MTDLLSLAPKLVTIADAGLKMWATGRRMQRGNPVSVGEALDQLLGLGDAVRPGTRKLAEDGFRVVTEGAKIATGMDYIEGEWRELHDGPPWADLKRHLAALPWGVIIIVGNPGQGKSEFAKKTMATWFAKDHRPCEWVNWYEGDLPDFGQAVSAQRIIARIVKVGRFLNQEAGEDVDDGLTDDDLRSKKRPPKEGQPPARKITQREINQMGYRDTAVDEAGIFFSNLGDAGQQDSREAAKRWSDQIRHLNGRLLLIAQKLSDIPPHVRSTALHIYKAASPGLIEEDYKPGTKRVTTRKWEEALLALKAIQTGRVPDFPVWMTDPAKDAIKRAAAAHDEWWPVFPDLRSWLYAVGGLGGHSVRTIAPFSLYRPTSDQTFHDFAKILESEAINNGA